MKYAPNAAISSSSTTAGLSVQRQASRLSRAVLPAITMSQKASAKPQPRRLPCPGSRATACHSGRLQALASQALVSSTTWAGWIGRRPGGLAGSPGRRANALRRAIGSRRRRVDSMATGGVRRLSAGPAAGRRGGRRPGRDGGALGAGEQLAGGADFVLGVADHFVELRNPADGARQRKDAGKQLDRDADRALHDAGVKIHVRVELALHEVVVFERDFLQ